MEFNEQFYLKDDFQILTKGNKSISKDVLNENHKSILLVNLLPSHPFQYPFHQQIKEFLTADTFTGLKKEIGITEIIFIVNKKLRFFYTHILSALECRTYYANPQYPFTFSNLKKLRPYKENDCINVSWSEFISMCFNLENKAIEELPISISQLTGNARKIKKSFLNMKVPFRISELANNIGISLNDFILTDHPFIGKFLSGDTEITEMKPLEIIVLPKEHKTKKSILSKILFKFKRNYKSFINEYNTQDQYQHNPCQKCLHCSIVCPAKLYPFMLSAFSKRGSLKDAVQQNISDCIECGLCTYVCPSGIPLMHNIKNMKKELK